jgi:hypothetical protein
MTTILFVHGMGRSTWSGWRMLALLRRAGFKTATFGYQTRSESFAVISQRLQDVLSRVIEEDGDAVAIGHSLGGVLLRAAIHALPDHRRPRHLFLLGSPQRAARLASRFSGWWLYRRLSGDCGALLASEARMAMLPAAPPNTTSIVGTAGPRQRFGAFGGAVNDGVVSLDEVRAEGLTDEILVAQVHTLLPASPSVAKAILSRLQGHAPVSPGQ